MYFPVSCRSFLCVASLLVCVAQSVRFVFSAHKPLSLPAQIPLAEMEALSLASEKSWSLALTDDSAPDDFNPLFLTSLECNVLTVPLFLSLHLSSSFFPSAISCSVSFPRVLPKPLVPPLLPHTFAPIVPAQFETFQAAIIIFWYS